MSRCYARAGRTAAVSLAAAPAAAVTAGHMPEGFHGWLSDGSGKGDPPDRLAFWRVRGASLCSATPGPNL